MSSRCSTTRARRRCATPCTARSGGSQTETEKPCRRRAISPYDPPSESMEPLDDTVDHVRGPADARLLVEYGDYECPYSRQAFREIERVERQLSDGVRFAFRHFPLTEIHPHALAASAAAEAAARQDRFWEMHELLFHRQKALEDDDLRRYAAELELDLPLFDCDRTGAAVLGR